MVAAWISVHIHICISINCIYKMDITSKSKMSLKMIEEKYDLLFNSVSLIVQRYCWVRMDAWEECVFSKTGNKFLRIHRV